MSRTQLHLLAGLAWHVLAALGLAALPLPDVITQDKIVHYGLLAGLYYLGFAAVFFSWARKDIVEHGSQQYVALLFATLWLFGNVIGNFPYLLYTRGWRKGFLASLKFAAVVIAAWSAWYGLEELMERLHS